MQLPPQWNIHPVFHASLLTSYIKTKEHSENIIRPPPDMIEGEVEYEVEAIRAHQYRRCKLQYLIKWKGYLESDNTWEPVNNVQVPQLIKKYHMMHPLEDKRMMEQARMTSFTPQPTWLLKSDPQSTFNDVEVTAAALAATAAAAMTVKAAGLPSPSTPALPPPSPSEYLTSLSGHSFVTLPSIPHINSSNLGHTLYPVKIPMFFSTPHSITSLTSIGMNTCAFAQIITAKLTDKCLTVLTPPPMKHTACPSTPLVSPHPLNLWQAQPSWKSCCLQQLPPSYSPLSVTSPSKTTHQSHQHQPRQSSPSTQHSMPPFVPQPSGSPPPSDKG